MCVDQFPHKSLGVRVNMFANTLKVVHLVIAKKKTMLTLVIMVYTIETNPKIESMYSISFQKIYTYLRLALIVCTQFPLENPILLSLSRVCLGFVHGGRNRRRGKLLAVRKD